MSSLGESLIGQTSEEGQSGNRGKKAIRGSSLRTVLWEIILGNDP